MSTKPFPAALTHIQDGERGKESDVLRQLSQLVGGQVEFAQERLLPPALRVPAEHPLLGLF